MTSMLQSALGLLAFCGIAWVISENRARVSWKLIVIGLFMQLMLGLVLLKVTLVNNAFQQLNGVVLALEEATGAGTTMVFGYLGGGSLPFAEPWPGAGFILAFRALPIILVISALSALLFHWRVLPFIINTLARLLQKSLKVGGAEGLGLAANIFVGMVEAPILVRPYIERMTRSELFSVMTCGMATVAGTVIVLYASILSDTVPGALGHVLVASVISVPAAYVISKVMIPETREVTPANLDHVEQSGSSFEAIVDGTTRGIQLLVNVVAMIIVMVALVKLLNILLSLLPHSGEALTLQGIFALVFSPLTWLIGIPTHETAAAAKLLGTKTMINEFVAYLDMAALSDAEFGARSRTVMTYALCGFANPGSLGIIIGGLASMAPARKAEIIALAWRSVIAGTLATCMTGAVANLFLGAT